LVGLEVLKEKVKGWKQKLHMPPFKRLIMGEKGEEMGEIVPSLCHSTNLIF